MTFPNGRLGVSAVWIFLPVALFAARPIEAANNCTPPLNGDWVINYSQTCSGKNLTLTGNIVINGPSGSLRLVNSSVRFAIDNKVIDARQASQLTIDNTDIFTGNPAIKYNVFVAQGVSFSVSGSRIRNFGRRDPELWIEAPSGTDEAELFKDYLWGHTYDGSGLTDGDGLVVRSTPVSFTGNTFDDYTVIRFYSSGNVITFNHFRNMKHEGLAFMDGSNGNTVTDNSFQQAAATARMNRTIYGLRFYPNPSVPCGTQFHEIARNHFERVPYTIAVGNIHPWTYSCNFQIHDNVHVRTTRGLGANIRHSDIHNETFSNVMAGIGLVSARDVTITNSEFSDLTYQMEIDQQIGRSYWELIELKQPFTYVGEFTFQFFAGKSFIMLSRWTAGVTIENNTFLNAPPGTIAINTDGVFGYDFTIRGNRFESIGTHIPPGYVVRRDVNCHVPLGDLATWCGLPAVPGAAIMLETADHPDPGMVTIDDNEFVDVQAALTTTSLDALGSWGAFVFTNNVVTNPTLPQTFTWTEEVWQGSLYACTDPLNPQCDNWYDEAHPQQRAQQTIGVATGMRVLLAVPEGEQAPTFQAIATQTIEGNAFSNLAIPIAADYSRPPVNDPWGEMGRKTLDFAFNEVSSYQRCPVWNASTDGSGIVNILNFHDNLWLGGPACPQDQDPPPADDL